MNHDNIIIYIINKNKKIYKPTIILLKNIKIES